MRRFIATHTIGELMILMIAITVCFMLLAAGATVTLTELIHPEADTTEIVNTLTRVLNTLIGVIAGYLAGRTDVTHRNGQAKQQDLDQGSDYGTHSHLDR